MHTERENLAPIVGGGHVVPGPIRGHCPEPTEIVCVEVKKVFDFCFQEHRVERTFPVPREVGRMGHDHHHGRTEVECEIEAHKITCREVGERREVPNKKDRFLVCVAIDVPVTFSIFTCDSDTACSTFTRVVTVQKKAERGANMKMEVMFPVAYVALMATFFTAMGRGRGSWWMALPLIAGTGMIIALLLLGSADSAWFKPVTIAALVLPVAIAVFNKRTEYRWWPPFTMDRRILGAWLVVNGLLMLATVGLFIGLIRSQ